MCRHQCGICYETIENDLYKTPCNHIYHNKCLTQWLLYNTSCPMCRHSYGENKTKNTEKTIEYKENIIIKKNSAYINQNCLSDNLTNSLREIIDYHLYNSNIIKYNWKLLNDNSYTLFLKTKKCNFKINVWFDKYTKLEYFDQILELRNQNIYLEIYDLLK